MTTTATVTYSPVGQDGGYDIYSSLSDLLSEGFANSTVVEVDGELGILTTTIGELAGVPAVETAVETAVAEVPAKAPTEPATTTTVYARGTKTCRSTTASLVAGDQVLTSVYVFKDGRTCITYATSKTGAVIRTVAGKTADMARGSRRAQRRYDVQFTDGTEAANLAPVQSWHVVSA
jgi:hypothetical protein